MQDLRAITCYHPINGLVSDYLILKELYILSTKFGYWANNERGRDLYEDTTVEIWAYF